MKDKNLYMEEPTHNPFSDTPKLAKRGTAQRVVQDQVLDMEVGESKLADKQHLTTKEFRTALVKVCIKFKIKIKTKTGYDGCLWVKRVA